MTVISPDDVRVIFDTSLTDTMLQGFCDMAQAIIDEDLAGSGLSENRLKLIGINLAAHYATMRERQVQSKVVETRLSTTYQGQTGKGFDSSFYGQTAVNMDTTGTLADMGANLKTPSLWVAGYPPENS